MVEKEGHAFCYIHSKDTAEYPVLASTVHVERFCLFAYNTWGTNIDPQSSLEKKSRQENLKVTKATKSLHFSITIFSSVAGQKRKAPFG